MWLIAMFDIPTETKAHRRLCQVQEGIMRDGFTMMQYSVYIRHCASENSAYCERVKGLLPGESGTGDNRQADRQDEGIRKTATSPSPGPDRAFW